MALISLAPVIINLLAVIVVFKCAVRLIAGPAY